ncbi:MAG: 50S ribosomal protein L23 [Candidatus Nitrosotenuis sp.]
MNTTEAIKIILRPYVTEKTFALIEKDSRICFIVESTASKPIIKEAIKTLYEEDVIDINTAKTISGKKAFVKFESVEKARDLATKIGML